MEAAFVGAGFGLFGLVTTVFGLGCVFGLLGLVSTLFWLWMLIDALANEPTTNDKLLWFLVIFFLHFIGALIYFVVRRPNRPRAGGPPFG